MDNLAKWLGAQLDKDASNASSWHTLGCDIHAYLEGDAESVKATMAMFHAAPGAVCDCGVPARVLREIDAKRQLLVLHAPERAVVDGACDQSGTGETQVCRTCGNEAVEPWVNRRPPEGEGDEVAEGVALPYAVAPCATLRLLALPYADRPGYHEDWRP
ncbi:DUF6221 family protein [Streptomyces xanthii]|uniref:Uncharacterized protein n=1 Tax=Streptomyces xanthii TaxID=2768069 RepID=A0A7H1BHX8_9ACTN|nr:DUF6221 family protein [Streptomyces xanthii]QNS08333.1 hypothetical protein IAG42_35210 [Streptomyces xanthii]